MGTTEEPDDGEQESEDEDPDLEALFDSIPSEELDDQEPVEGSPPEEDETASDPFTFEDDPDVAPEDTDGTSQRGRFTDFIEGVDDSDEQQNSDEATSDREDIQDLLGRVDGASSTQTPDEGLEPEGFMEADFGSSEIDSESWGSPDETDGSDQFDDPALEGLADASDVLFEASRGDGGSETDACQQFFLIEAPSEQNVLLVSLRQSAEDCRQTFLNGAEGEPANLAVISSSEEDRQRQTGSYGRGGASGMTMKVVDDPGDLTRLGITISNVLSSWQDNEQQTLVCFDSVSILLQYAELQRVFRFIHVLQGRLGNVGARTHYHLNPEAHDTQTEATIRSLFDGVVTVSESGELAYE